MALKDEQEWFRKFYEGTFLIKGWKHRMKELLQAVPESDRERVKDLLENLGQKIGREWARENRLRRIDTPTLQKWGDNLRSAKRKGPTVLVEQIRKLDAEVDGIIASA
jgi:hypothetical protein